MHIKNPQLLTDLFQAYEDARRHKRKTKGVLEFSLNYEERLFQLYEDLVYRRYKIAPSTCFIVTKPVWREIFAGDFRDRIVHHLLFNYLNPFCERLFINDSYACRKGKGTSYGISRADHFIRSMSENYTRDCWVLKLDISGYFMSINHSILQEKVLKIIERYEEEIKFDQSLVRWLLEKIIFHNHVEQCIRRGEVSDWSILPRSKSLFYAKSGCGLPIGNLTSQLFGNVYLNDFDHFAMRLVPCLRYGRYVDDMLFVHKDRETLLRIVSSVREFLSTRLLLILHPNKVRLGRYEHGVDFLGARLYCGRILPQQQLVRNLRENICQWNESADTSSLSREEVSALISSFNSSLGHFVNFQTRQLRKDLLSMNNASLMTYIRSDNKYRKVVMVR
ncbi:group II intron reverse transcriptase domain-containing protein [Candidatus Kaiserbacteria bacterium]|nr:group II intron reverse transcriptase domain-containing protein [Candidatus Kaiserbacteria bacterium]MCB9818289.1 group II intron reverse transcriptase domain-containing protein [Candidatus Nomurabacteria bacterium]